MSKTTLSWLIGTILAIAIFTLVTAGLYYALLFFVELAAGSEVATSAEQTLPYPQFLSLAVLVRTLFFLVKGR